MIAGSPRIAAAGMLLALLAAAPAAAQRLPAGTAACIDSLGAAEAALAPDAQGRALAGQHCEEYVFLLERSEFAALLPAGSASALDREGLELLLALESDFAEQAVPGIDTANLQAVVASLRPFDTPPEPSLWQRLREWLESLLQSDEGEPTWIGEWLERLRIPDSWLPAIMYGIAGLAVLAILAILVNELRLGGAFLGRTGRRAIGRVLAAGAVPEGEPPSFAAIAATPSLARRTELLFALVVDRLRSRAPGQVAPGLTHREILRRDSGLDASARASLGRIADAAERVTYAGWRPGRADWESVLASGEALVRRLDTEADVPA